MYEAKVYEDTRDYEVYFGTEYIKKGDRIAQMLIERNEDFELVEADELSDTDRGTGGFGSTGK